MEVDIRHNELYCEIRHKLCTWSTYKAKGSPAIYCSLIVLQHTFEMLLTTQFGLIKSPKETLSIEGLLRLLFANREHKMDFSHRAEDCYTLNNVALAKGTFVRNK